MSIDFRLLIDGPDGGTLVRNDLSVNMHDASAARLLSTLGLSVDDEPVTPDDFLGRVLTGVALEPADEGMPGFTEGRWSTGGRHAGRTEELLGELRRLAEEGRKMSAEGHPMLVCWS